MNKNNPRRSRGRSHKEIEQYEHRGEVRLNNPPVGLVTSELNAMGEKKGYKYDPHLDPQLDWAGKAEHTTFEVDTISLHVHERIEPKTIIEAVRKKKVRQKGLVPFFASPDQNLPFRDAIEFYRHQKGWSNRLVAGDSLLVMNSLLEREGFHGKVQMIYIDPPYGIKYSSNFQPFVNKKSVKDGKDEDLTQEPEMIKAFRDTWELGIHSYLSCLRDRLLLARQLLSESGSIFIQISDENIHHIKELMDEVFNKENFCALITFRKTGWKASKLLSRISDYIIWYAKDIKKIKFNPLYFDKLESGAFLGQDIWIEEENGNRRRLSSSEISLYINNLPKGCKLFRHTSLTSAGYNVISSVPFEFEGRIYSPGNNQHWKTSPEGLRNAVKQNRLIAIGNSLRFVSYLDDLSVSPITALWPDTAISGFSTPKIFVVQTNPKVISRCILMTTDPGDIVFDPTCGSGTSAFCAEKWGRRWITCDTSRVAITLTKQRLMTEKYNFYELLQPKENVGGGFKYKSIQHITLKIIANNETPGKVTLYDQPIIARARALIGTH